ncbi:hypothetical protein LguiB_018156 [Lonicera macranthoides]
MNFPRTKITKTFSENENSENKDCKTENGENIILAFCVLRFKLEFIFRKRFSCFC